MKPLRVAIIHPFLFRYARGIERFTFNLANVLARSGVEMHLLTWRWHSPIQIAQLEPWVQVHTLPTGRYFEASTIVPFYVWHLLTHRYDFLWIYFAGYGEAEALTIARQQKFGVVFHFPYDEVPHRYREFQRFGLVQRAAQIVSVSRFVADGVRESLGLDSTVIHHGVDTQRFAPDPNARQQVRQSLGLDAETPLLLTAAALEERKGIQWVLRALPEVVRQCPQVAYIVVGDGDYRAELERITHALGLDRVVRFLGVRERVDPFYQAADLTLLLSHGEASSLTVLESLACAVPVITSQHPPFDELIESEHGIMVDENDASAVAAAINELLCDRPKRRAMGDAGRKHVLADFTWERVGNQYQQLLNSIA